MPVLLLLVGCFGLTTVPKQDAATGPGDSGTTTVGALEIDATALSFGDVAIGASATRDLTLSNTGEGALGVALSLTGDGVYEVSTTDLDVDADEVVTVTFTPATEGPYTGTLGIAVDSGDTLSIPLSGTGVEGDADTDADTDTDTEPSGPGPNIVVSPARYDFGNVDLDSTETTTFTVSNNGDDDLLISDVRTSGAVWTTDGTLSPPQVLSPGANKLLEVTFAPTAETAYTGTITILSDDPDTPEKTIAVEGTGVDMCDICAPLIDVDTGGSSSTSMTDFVSFLGAADTRTITIRNLGDMDLVVSDVIVNNDVIATCGSFTLGGWSSARTLAPGGTASFTLSYRATETCLDLPSTTFDTNVVHILSNDPSASDWVIELQGTRLI
ncbi:MAG: choice-of-anchor D domain-containing protein [Myxococcota bacterium]